jgi:thioesterase domain-containing protein
MEGVLIEGDLPEPKKVKPPRTHWDMLLERRTIEELDELLKERLEIIRHRRRGS